MNYLEEIYKTIESRSGLTINVAHKLSMRDFILQRISECNMTEEEYYSHLQSSQKEFNLIINEAAINETYFFREEKQFDFLKLVYFPQNAGKTLSIWSAACSSGEEPLSLYTLAKHCNIDVKVYASDIDTHALQTMQNRVYRQNSFRSDGSKFHSLLNTIGTYQDKELIINEDILNNINSFYYNLISTAAPKLMPESMDIIFIRNVFIYFTPEVRKRILQRLSTILKPSGIMFLSINEIVTIENASELQLKKEHTGSVYYLKKVDKEELKKEKRVILSKPECKQEQKKEKSVPDEDNDIKELYSIITSRLNKHDCTAAWCVLHTQYFAPHKMEFLYYFEGLIYIEQNETVKAEESFSKATILNKDFWPAIFQMGMMQKKNGKDAESKKTFRQCSQVINSYVKSNNICYNAFTGSFSPEYFLVLCTNFINGV
ncbi:MAG: hypothetical protein K6G00_05200, partial [Treponema sp.]|nr:hypothetical protein [Treponema sp.]